MKLYFVSFIFKCLSAFPLLVLVAASCFKWDPVFCLMNEESVGERVKMLHIDFGLVSH